MFLMGGDCAVVRIRGRVENLVHQLTRLRCHSVNGFASLHGLAGAVLLRLRIEDFAANGRLAPIGHCVLTLVTFIPTIFNHEDFLAGRRDIGVQWLPVFAFVANCEQWALPVAVCHRDVVVAPLDLGVAAVLATHV